MINKEWTPKADSDLAKTVDELKLQVKSDMPVEKIVKMQLEVLMLASSLTTTIANARFYEAKMNAEARSVYTQSFLTAEGSDRKRDATAKATATVRVAESKAFEAEVTRKLIEDYKEDLVAIHYAVRAMLKDRTEERKFNQG